MTKEEQAAKEKEEQERAATELKDRAERSGLSGEATLEEVEAEERRIEDTEGKKIRINPETQEPYTEDELAAVEKKEKEDRDTEAQETRDRNAAAAKRRIDTDKARLKDENERLRRENEKLTGGKKFDAGDEHLLSDTEYWNEELRKNPADAMNRREEQKRSEEARAHQDKSAKDKLVNDANESLVESKQTVYDKHPELKDETSEKSQVFLSVLQQHPEFLTSPTGPLKAMREMEKILKVPDPDKKVVADPEEAARLSRVNGGNLGTGRPAPEKKTVVLTKEQLDYCRDNDIKPENYAKSLMRITSGEGKVTV